MAPPPKVILYGIETKTNEQKSSSFSDEILAKKPCLLLYCYWYVWGDQVFCFSSRSLPTVAVGGKRWGN